jgi:hypothetical protein
VSVITVTAQPIAADPVPVPLVPPVKILAPYTDPETVTTSPFPTSGLVDDAVKSVFVWFCDAETSTRTKADEFPTPNKKGIWFTGFKITVDEGKVVDGTIFVHDSDGYNEATKKSTATHSVDIRVAKGPGGPGPGPSPIPGPVLKIAGLSGKTTVMFPIKFPGWKGHADQSAVLVPRAYITTDSGSVECKFDEFMFHNPGPARLVTFPNAPPGLYLVNVVFIDGVEKVSHKVEMKFVE